MELKSHTAYHRERNLTYLYRRTSAPGPLKYHKLVNKMVGTAKQTILTTARKYFEVFEWDDEASKLRVWRGCFRKSSGSTQLVKRAISALSRT